MPEHAASSAELTGVCQRLAAHYTALAEKESARGAAGYARLDKERVQCLRLIERCLASGLRQEVRHLVENIKDYLDRQGYWIERVDVFEMRLTAAHQAGDRKDEGECLNSLGYTCSRRGEDDKAMQWYKQCLPIRREVDDKNGEGTTLNNIARIHEKQGKYEQALELYQQSLTILREVGDIEGEGTILNNAN